MYVKQADLFRGMDKDFIKRVMDITKQQNLEEGAVLFEEGQAADRVYILLTGHVRLSIGDTAQTVYTVNHAGELFGWSTLMGRERFSATAVCTRPVKVLAIERDELAQLLNEDAENGMVFYRRVARMLGNRLLESYGVISSFFSMSDSPTQATGQLVDEPPLH